MYNDEKDLRLVPCLAVQQVYADYCYLMEKGKVHDEVVDILALTYGPFSEFGMFELEEGDDDDGDEDDDDDKKPVIPDGLERWL